MPLLGQHKAHTFSLWKAQTQRSYAYLRYGGWKRIWKASLSNSHITILLSVLAVVETEHSLPLCCCIATLGVWGKAARGARRWCQPCVHRAQDGQRSPVSWGLLQAGGRRTSHNSPVLMHSAARGQGRGQNCCPPFLGVYLPLNGFVQPCNERNGKSCMATTQ